MLHIQSSEWFPPLKPIKLLIKPTNAIHPIAAELVVLPAWAPGGMCGGSLLAEGAAWGLLGTATDLGSLLAGSKDLEQVQAFSLARKLGQMVMLQGALSLALGAASRRSRSQLFNFSLASPLQPGRLATRDVPAELAAARCWRWGLIGATSSMTCLQGSPHFV
ncbi:hypothetical protein QJQ45_022461 [Haematococcus lacustris]|nr:hypothetical protein QJQ45_022461 [Haematococcus lacustris]